jgi:hypothetical protein
MAIVQLGSLVHSIKGRFGGSVLRNNTYGCTLYSNNWTKRKTTWRFHQNRAQQGALSSAWRSLTVADQLSWVNQTRYPQVSPQDGTDTTSPFNLFSQINSKLKKSQAPAHKKPPRGKNNDTFFHFCVITHTSDLSSVGIGMPDVPSDSQCSFWVGPFQPVWSTYNTSYKLFAADSAFGAHTTTWDVSGVWQSIYGPLPADPGYVQLGGQYDYAYIAAGPGVFVYSLLTFHIVSVNGAPPYHP